MFNVAYEDGMVTSNRRVSSELLDDSFCGYLQDSARTSLAEQHNESTQRSAGRPRQTTTTARGETPPPGPHVPGAFSLGHSGQRGQLI